jgi:hypothetical protein
MAHEIGHYVLTKKPTGWLVNTAPTFGVDPWDTPNLPFGQFNYEEAFADSFATYHLNRSELRRRYPGWYQIVEAAK